MNLDLSAIPPGWFIYSMGEVVTPVTYCCDTHDHISFYCDLQHRRGGRLQKQTGLSLQEALATAIVAARRMEQERPDLDWSY